MLQTTKCKLCRREGKKLFLKGERCNLAKCAFTRRPYAPGKSDKFRGGKLSDFAKQLRAKQACKRIFKISEKMFNNYYKKAAKAKDSTGEVLLQLLHTRLDNVVYELGFASSRANAQQFVSHGHILVNNKKVNIISYQVKPTDKISIAPNSKSLVDTDKKSKNIPEWLKLTSKTGGQLAGIPTKENIITDIDIQLIVEFYNR